LLSARIHAGDHRNNTIPAFGKFLNRNENKSGVPASVRMSISAYSPQPEIRISP
jgi:hypothetical protein